MNYYGLPMVCAHCREWIPDGGKYFSIGEEFESAEFVCPTCYEEFMKGSRMNDRLREFEDDLEKLSEDGNEMAREWLAEYRALDTEEERLVWFERKQVFVNEFADRIATAFWQFATLLLLSVDPIA